MTYCCSEQKTVNPRGTAFIISRPTSAWIDITHELTAALQQPQNGATRSKVVSFGGEFEPLSTTNYAPRCVNLSGNLCLCTCVLIGKRRGEDLFGESLRLGCILGARKPNCGVSTWPEESNISLHHFPIRFLFVCWIQSLREAICCFVMGVAMAYTIVEPLCWSFTTRTCSGWCVTIVLLYFSAAFTTKTVRVGDNSVLFQIWDTAGQEKVCNNSSSTE